MRYLVLVLFLVGCGRSENVYRCDKKVKTVVEVSCGTSTYDFWITGRTHTPCRVRFDDDSRKNMNGPILKGDTYTYSVNCRWEKR